jgi:hypothetical protein
MRPMRRFHEGHQMSNTNTGGPAFPFVCDADFDYGTGMTLRDYFAAKAMQGFLATVKVGCPDDLIAVDAYNLADAMLKAREA